MKLDTQTTTVEGDLVGQKIDMKIDPTAFAHIMQALVKLYANTELAVIREISTNARDAHIEAGRPHLPIEVTLPTRLDPYFRVKDYGPGLSVDDITNIYSQYGASTKRDTNDQVGSLGFGCKSPLAYTDQFNLTSVCDGVQIKVLVSKDANGGNMQIVDTCSTDAHSGVIVEVPVARWNNFELYADQFFRFWEPGTVLVNGSHPTPIKGRVITDDLMIIDGDRNYVVMGNVPYPVDRERLTTDLNAGHSLVARVPIGAVSFIPARENLAYDIKTAAALKQIETDFTVGIQTAVQNAIDLCKTRPEVIDTVRDWRQSLPESRVGQKFTFKGEDVPHVYEVPGASDGQRIVVAPYTAHKLNACDRRQRLDLSFWPKGLFVYGYDRDNFSAPLKKKLLKYADDNNIEVGNFILLPSKPAGKFLKWIDKSRLVEFSTITAIKLPRTYAGGGSNIGRIPGSYDMYIDGKFKTGVEADTIDRNNPIFYVARYARDLVNAGLDRYVDLLTVKHPSNTVVILSPNRVAKFLRDAPEAQELVKSVEDYYAEWLKALTENQKIAIKMDNMNGSWNMSGDLKSLDPSLVHDRELKRAIRIMAKDEHKVIIHQWNNFRNILGYRVVDSSKLPKYVNPLEKYILFDLHVVLNKNTAPHMYRYLNAEYAHLQSVAK